MLRWVGVLFSRLMRQIKQLFVGVLITMIVVLVFIFIYRDDDIDPMPDFPPGLRTTAQKEEFVQKKWRKMEKIALDRSDATNLVKRLVQEKGSILTPLQKTLLEEKLTAWFYQLKTGAYEDFMSFKEPDYYEFNEEFNPGQVAYGRLLQTGVWDGLSWKERLKAWGSVSKEEINKIWVNLTNDEKIEALHRYNTSLRFDSIRIESIHLNVRKWRQRVKEVLSPYHRFYPGGGSLIHSDTPLKYRVKPIDVMKKHWGIEWARFRAGYDSLDYEGYVFAIQLALYWSPDEKRWLAGEGHMVNAPRYVWDGKSGTPRIFF